MQITAVFQYKNVVADWRKTFPHEPAARTTPWHMMPTSSVVTILTSHRSWASRSLWRLGRRVRTQDVRRLMLLKYKHKKHKSTTPLQTDVKKKTNLWSQTPPRKLIFWSTKSYWKMKLWCVASRKAGEGGGRCLFEEWILSKLQSQQYCGSRM